MSREILFRALVKDKQKIYNIKKIDFDYRIVWFEEENKPTDTMRMFDQVELMQFTGLTDKNGKKIFEGDILRLCNATYPILVYWDCLGWKFLRNGKRVQGAFECDIKHDIEICEVIGNIFDNAEFLQEK